MGGLDEPEPVAIFNTVGSSGLEFLLAVWAAREDCLALKKAMMATIKQRFDEAGIEIPFPHVSLYTGHDTQPFPVTWAAGADAADKPS